MSSQKAKKNYRELAGNDDNDSDSDRPRKKLKPTNVTKQAINAPAEYDENGEPTSEININKKFPVYAAKDKDVGRARYVCSLLSIWRWPIQRGWN